MPSSVVHRYIGLDTLDKLNKKPMNIINERRNNYVLYCQCTDVFYFYRIMGLFSNKVQYNGHLFHWRKVFKSFEYLINLNKENKDYELFTFIAGFITHYKADSIMHPYINYKSFNNDKVKHQDNHFMIETYLDNYYLNKREKVDYRKYQTYKLIFNYTKEDIIKEAIEGMYKTVFNEKGMGNKYYKGASSMKHVFRFIRLDRFRIKKQLYKLIDLNPFKIRRTRYLSYNFPLDRDEFMINSNHQEWYNIKDTSIKSTKSFDDLWKDVVSESTIIINELYKYIFEDKDIDLLKLVGNYSLSNGLPLKD
jgi:hypothetical protein